MKAPSIKVFQNASREALGLTRVLICLIWITRLSTDSLQHLNALPIELFYPQGLMSLLPDAVIQAFIENNGLFYLRHALVLVLGLACIGAWKSTYLFISVALGCTLYLGILKGFGGHVNHRELVLLYSTYILCFFDSNTAFALKRTAHKSDTSLPLQLIVTIIALNYFFVGIARAFVGAPEVFSPSVMETWVYNRAYRPSPYDFNFALGLMSYPFLKALITHALLPSTILEIIFPLVLFCKKNLRVLLALSMMSFHVGIFLTMKIPFFENIALLLLCLGIDPWRKKNA